MNTLNHPEPVRLQNEVPLPSAYSDFESSAALTLVALVLEEST